MLYTKNRMSKGDAPITIFSVVVTLIFTILILVTIISSNLSVKNYFKENSNAALSTDISYRSIKCISPAEFGTADPSLLNNLDSFGDCVGFKDLKYKIQLKDLDLEREWIRTSEKYPNVVGFESAKTSRLFFIFGHSNGATTKGEVYVTFVE